MNLNNDCRRRILPPHQLARARVHRLPNVQLPAAKLQNLRFCSPHIKAKVCALILRARTLLRVVDEGLEAAVKNYGLRRRLGLVEGARLWLNAGCTPLARRFCLAYVCARANVCSRATPIIRSRFTSKNFAHHALRQKNLRFACPKKKCRWRRRHRHCHDDDYLR